METDGIRPLTRETKFGQDGGEGGHCKHQLLKEAIWPVVGLVQIALILDSLLSWKPISWLQIHWPFLRKTLVYSLTE